MFAHNWFGRVGGGERSDSIAVKGPVLAGTVGWKRECGAIDGRVVSGLLPVCLLHRWRIPNYACSSHAGGSTGRGSKRPSPGRLENISLSKRSTNSCLKSLTLSMARSYCAVVACHNELRANSLRFSNGGKGKQWREKLCGLGPNMSLP